MNLTPLFEQLIEKQNLSADQMEAVMCACMKNELAESQITAFLALMRMKGETAEELASAAKILRQFARHIDLGDNLIDIVGTGGDGKNTFNISTTSSIVAAAAGVRIAKHGNLSVSSRSGSANVLREAGIPLQQSDEQLQHSMKQDGICFLFAPQFHPTLHYVRTARQRLGIRSFFNLIGPLVNPAHVKKQVVGVCNAQLLKPMATVLAHLGSERALIISARDGLDEISVAATTDVIELSQGEYHSWSIDPQQYSCYHTQLDSILVNSPKESLDLMQATLLGEKGAARDIVLLNSGAALYLAELAVSMEKAIQLAAQTIDSGKAFALFERLRQ